MSHSKCVFATFSLAAIVATVPVVAQSWTPTAAPVKVWSSIACSADGTRIVALAKDGSIYTSTNSGADWLPQLSPALNWASVASSALGDKLIGVAYNATGLVYLSTNSGVSWAPATAPATNWACVCSSADGRKLAAAVSYGMVYISTNSGADWTPTTAPVAYWNGIASSASGQKLLAVGSYWIDFVGSTVSISANSGDTWNSPSSSPLWLSAASCANAGTLIAGAFGTVYTSGDLGTSWSSTGLPSGTWFSVASSADGRCLAAAPNTSGHPPALIYTSTNSGLSWAPASVPSTNWSSVACSADGCFIVAAVGGWRNYPGLIYTSQSIPSPALAIATAGNPVTVSWAVPSMNFVLQSASSPTATNWTDFPVSADLNYTDLRYEVTIPPSNPTAFYRLSLR